MSLPRTDPPASLDESPRGILIFGLTVIAVFFGGFGAWAALAPFNSAAVAPAFVKVQSNRKTVQHLEGGIVREILVKEGQLVRAGEIVVRLDKTQARAAYDILAKQHGSFRAQEARLIAERDNFDTISFPRDLLDRQNDPEIERILRGQTNQFKTKLESLESQTKILKSQIEQIRQQIVGIEGKLQGNREQSRLIADELKDTQQLYDQGNTTLIRLRQLQRAAAGLQGEGEDMVATIAKLRHQILQTEEQIIGIASKRQDEVAVELKEVQSKLQDLDSRLRAAKDTLDRADIAASETGFVVGLSTFTAGGVIKPGETLMQIVPEKDLLVLEAQVKVEDIESVRPDLDAIVHLTAFKERMVPQVRGTVTKVSADRLTDQRTGAPYYLVEVSIRLEDLPEERRPKLTPGMPASVVIPFGDRTALDYLIRPLTDSMLQAFREK